MGDRHGGPVRSGTDLRWFLGVVALSLGCRGPVAARAPGLIDSEPAELSDAAGALLRDLEDEIRSSYQRVALDAAAAAAVIDPEVGLVGFGIGPDAVSIGANAAPRWPVADVGGRPVAVVSRGLRMAMSEDQTVGWSYDELSVRLSVCDRIASIPLRAAQVWVRDGDHWTLVAEHLGYAQAATSGGGSVSEPGGVALEDAIERQPESQAARAAVAEAIAATGDRSGWDDGADALAVWPGVGQVQRGAAMRTGLSLARAVEAQTVELDGVRLALGPSRAVAIVSSTLLATAAGVTSDGKTSPPRRLRGTFVVERRSAGEGPDSWSVKMGMVSAPITTPTLLARNLGVAASLRGEGHVTITCR